MTLEEFGSRSLKKVTPEQYELIEFVYTWHPLISETEGKEQVAFLYNNFGIGIFKEMEPKAVEAMRIENEIFSLKKQISKLEQQMEDLRR